MKHLGKKYLKFITSFLIAIYSFSLIAAIFHYHHYDLASLNSISSQTTSDYQNLSLLSDTGLTCIILQNFTNLQTAVFSGINEQPKIYDERVFSQSYTSQFCLNQFHLSSNLLRAPPEYFL